MTFYVTARLRYEITFVAFCSMQAFSAEYNCFENLVGQRLCTYDLQLNRSEMY
jgi:hypothetical protein